MRQRSGLSSEPSAGDRLGLRGEDSRSCGFVTEALAFLVRFRDGEPKEIGNQVRESVDEAKDVPDEGLTPGRLEPIVGRDANRESRFPTVIRLRSRRPDLVSPFAVDFLRVPAQIGQRRTR